MLRKGMVWCTGRPGMTSAVCCGWKVIDETNKDSAQYKTYLETKYSIQLKKEAHPILMLLSFKHKISALRCITLKCALCTDFYRNRMFLDNFRIGHIRIMT